MQDTDTGVEVGPSLDRIRTKILDRLEDLVDNTSLRPRELIAAARTVVRLTDQETARARLAASPPAEVPFTQVVASRRHRSGD